MQFNNKNKHICVRCVPSCVPLSGNGTHSKTPSSKAFNVNVYHVYLLSYTRIRVYFASLLTIALAFLLEALSLNSKKHSHAKKIIINGIHGKHYLKSLIGKGLPVCMVFKYCKHDGKHHTHSYKGC